VHQVVVTRSRAGAAALIAALLIGALVVIWMVSSRPAPAQPHPSPPAAGEALIYVPDPDHANWLIG
jgi:hypothetical protein